MTIRRRNHGRNKTSLCLSRGVEGTMLGVLLLISIGLPVMSTECWELSWDGVQYIRGASSIERLGTTGLYAVVGDDAVQVDVIDPLEREHVAWVPLLPMSQPSHLRKAAKLDFEASSSIQSLLALFGSGSAGIPHRQSVALVEFRNLSGTGVTHYLSPMPFFMDIYGDIMECDSDVGTTPKAVVWMVHLPELYQHLTNLLPEGRDLNIEGVVCSGDITYFLNRGTASMASTVLTVHTTHVTNLLRSALLREGVPIPDALSIGNPVNSNSAIEQVVDVDLGKVDGVQASLTDGTMCHDTLWVVATAEDTTSTYEDGVVTGSLVGHFPSLTPVPTGRYPLPKQLGKVEGVAPCHIDACFHLVTDVDDPSVPSLFCTVESLLNNPCDHVSS